MSGLLWVILILVVGGLARAAMVPRPKTRSSEPLAFLITGKGDPTALVKKLVAQGSRVYVYTANPSSELSVSGAAVFSGDLPPEKQKRFLAEAASEDAPSKWLVFLSADAQAADDLAPRLSGYLHRSPAKVVGGISGPLGWLGIGQNPKLIAWEGSAFWEEGHRTRKNINLSGLLK